MFIVFIVKNIVYLEKIKISKQILFIDIKFILFMIKKIKLIKYISKFTRSNICEDRFLI